MSSVVALCRGLAVDVVPIAIFGRGDMSQGWTTTVFGWGASCLTKISRVLPFRGYRGVAMVMALYYDRLEPVTAARKTGKS